MTVIHSHRGWRRLLKPIIYLSYLMWRLNDRMTRTNNAMLSAQCPVCQQRRLFEVKILKILHDFKETMR
jgi:hypothetical protein